MMLYNTVLIRERNNVNKLDCKWKNIENKQIALKINKQLCKEVYDERTF